ncbi:MAG: LysM peptidoglycan-binding domain-containing protein [Planctomycetia bacterium]
MQQIERYGVIALVFLLVTIVAVSFWGDNKSPGFWSRLTGSKTAVVEDKNMTPPPSNGELTQVTPLPVGGDGMAPGTLPTVGGEARIGADAPFSSPINAPMADNTVGSEVSTPVAVTPIVQPDISSKTAGTKYIVKSGDSPARIAKRQLGSESRVNEILALNPGLNPKNLKVGQELILPVVSAQTSAQPVAESAKPAGPSAGKPIAPSAPKTPSKGGRSYKVQKGDTLSAIARRELGSASRAKDIQSMNPGLDPAKLKVGQTITLPGGSPAVAANVEPKRRVQ